MSQDELKQARIEKLKEVQFVRKENTRNQVYEAIENIKKRGDKINFHTIAREAGVSVSYLYKHTDLKQYVAELRSQQSSLPKPSYPSNKTVSSQSHTKIVSRLKERIHQLGEENQELKRKHEALAGQVYRVHFLEDQVARQQKIIEDLQAQLAQAKLVPMTQAKESQLESGLAAVGNDGVVGDEFKSEITKLGIRRNKELNQLLGSATPEQVRNALSVVREAMAAGKVRSKGGLFRSALKQGWEPNNVEGETEKSEFNEWYNLARSYGIVMGSAEKDGVIWVRENTGEWTPYQDFSKKWSLEYLQRVVR